MNRHSISFVLDDAVVELRFQPHGPWTPTTTLLQYLRSLAHHTGVKEGCAEGDCGACTVVLGGLAMDGRLQYRAVDACLVLLPMIHGHHLITVENVSDDSGLHAVQKALAENHGAQCGFCTPGFVMSLFALHKNHNQPSREMINDALTGNLCRCTGYRPIVEAAAAACVHHGNDHFTVHEAATADLLRSISGASITLTTPHQTYYQPSRLPEALLLKAEHPDAVVLSGATDVGLRVTKRHETIPEIIDLSRLPELKDVEDNDSGLILGAGLPLQAIRSVVQESFPALAEMLSVFGSLQIRNLATLGGNLGTASPISDTLPVLMAYGAKVIVESVHGRRKIDMDAYVTGYRQTARSPEELVTAVKIKKPASGTIVKFYKVSKRKDLDISTVSGGFRLERDPHGAVSRIVLAYGGMAEVTRRAIKTETWLTGKPWTRETVEAAMAIVDTEFTPISDARAGAEFRKAAARNLLLKFWYETSTPGARRPA